MNIDRWVGALGMAGFVSFVTGLALGSEPVLMVGLAATMFAHGISVGWGQ